MKIQYRPLEEQDIVLELFDSFDRYQEVKRCWRKEAGGWVLKEIAFEEQWSREDYVFLVQCLKNTLQTGGAVFGAFDDSGLAGFASVENEFMGKGKKDLVLSCLHVSNGKRGNGIGKSLFNLACKAAQRRGAEKLYISAHSSEESQAFYRAMGCAEAEEYDPLLFAKEPCDCHLECDLLNQEV